MFKRFVATVIIGGVWMLVGELRSIAQPVIAGQPCVPGTVRPYSFRFL